jgi:hypothetical protein
MLGLDEGQEVRFADGIKVGALDGWTEPDGPGDTVGGTEGLTEGAEEAVGTAEGAIEG